MTKLVVASVLYDAQVGAAMRLARAVAHGIEVARAQRVVEQGLFLLGDCGSPGLDADRLVEGTSDLTGAETVYHDFRENLGHSAGCNALVGIAGELAEDDVLVFLNPDAMPEAGALADLASAVARIDVGVADARQIPFEHPKNFHPRTGTQSWASGACLATRAGVFADVGGFDSDYFWSYCNDVDLSWRIRLKGLQAIHVPQAVVFHDKRISTSGKVIPTMSQDYYSTLGRLFLADRYGRPDLGRRTINWAVTHGSDSHRAAVESYRERQAHGTTPLPLPGAHEVATFVGGEYAEHRF